MLNVEHTIRSYSGRPGCMCGCNGSYNEGTRARKLAITKLLKDPETRLDVFNHVDDCGTAGCIHYDNGTRNRVLYVNKAGIDAIKQHDPHMVQED